MEIRVIAGGIFGADGEIPVGSEFTIQGEIPDAWAKKVEKIEGTPTDAVPIVNPDLSAKSKKRTALEKQAGDLGIGFSSEATDDELAAAIKTAKGK